jgi:hypothetical protein
MRNPLALLFRALLLWLSGRAHFCSDLEHISVQDRGECFSAFRKMVVEPTATQPLQPGAALRVRFSFKNLSAAANRRLSLLPIPLIVAQPGFRSKTWLLGEESDDFIGLYEFDTVRDAEAYWRSLPLRMMQRRAAPDSLTREVSAIGVDHTKPSS